MKIIADQNIPLLNEFFADIAEIQTFSGREITQDKLIDCDALLTRSVTKVNADLLQGTPVKFVGSCTIGMDHIDTEYLDQCKIQWANAPGCNANGVVQYIFSVMAQLLPDWQKKTVGIVGCGNIGKRLYQRLTALGMSVSCYDPFLELVDGKNKQAYNLTSFDEVLTADIITFHTPLTHSGAYPTYHLLGLKALSKVKSGALLINSCRGGVFDESALLAEIKPKKLKVALDVWEREPKLNFAVVETVNIATPHIAGYTLEGRQNGTAMVYQGFCEYFGIKAKKLSNILASDRTQWFDRDQTINELLLSSYPIMDDDKKLRAGISEQGTGNNNNQFATYFDQLRKNYPHRREYSHYRLPRDTKPKNTTLWEKIKIIQSG